MHNISITDELLLLLPVTALYLSMINNSLFFFIAFGGFIVRVPTLPPYLRHWAPQISFVRWALQGLVINEFEVRTKLK
jgi:hypothetical protein